MEAPPPIGEGNWYSGSVRLAWAAVGGARIRIEAGVISVLVARSLHWITGVARVDKERGRVVVAQVRLRPPWTSTVLWLDRHTWVAVGHRADRRLVEQLRQEGFDVVTDRRWPWSRPPSDLREAERHPEGDRQDSRLLLFRIALFAVAAIALVQLLL